MGIVYKAEDTKLKRPVALKFLPQALAANPQSRQRFMIEARAAAALTQANICTVHEIHDEGDSPFIAMEFVEGQSLRERIRGHPLEAREALDIAIQVAEAIEAAHQKGITHRDIKSSNIMVTGAASGRPGQAKVMDFGLAKVAGETLYTREGTTLGTVAYMSPEQARGQEVDQRTDLWSLGVVFYQMLSGRLPFAGDRDASILFSVVHEKPKPLREVAPGAPREFEQIVHRALQKDLAARYQSAADMLEDLRNYQDSLKAKELGALTPRRAWRLLRNPKIAVALAAGLIAIVAFSVWLSVRQSRIRWAREQALPEIERLAASFEVGCSNFLEAYRLAEKAEKYIPGDPKLAAVFARCSARINIKTEPAGAAVYLREVSVPGGQWRYAGISPLLKVRVPAAIFAWRIEKQGYETAMAVASTFQLGPNTGTWIVPVDFSRVLDPVGKIPPGMVRVRGGDTAAGPLPDFFIDMYEVTNKQYKEFVSAGGYRDPKYWRHEFVRDGRGLTRDDAMAELVDQTGRPGPSTWSAGDYPKGQDDYPVSGVSWYEAAAYAGFVGKSLPTLHHWEAARGSGGRVGPTGPAWLAQASNFKGDGPARVGSHPGLSDFGAYDMAGNVREWCWNEAGNGRVIRGGAWNDAWYMSDAVSQAPAFDRSPRNGFRCARYIDPDKVPSKAFEPYARAEAPELYKQKPVSDSIFQVYREQFAYDKKPLNARVEWRKESAADWVQEKVSVDAAYASERLAGYLFLPKKPTPPYQTVIYFPGSPSVMQPTSRDLDRSPEFVSFLSFLVGNGRAVLYPVYKATFERGDPVIAAIHNGANTRQFTEYAIQLVKDFSTSIDYLQTRADIDSKRLAFLGMSWGGHMGPLVLAVEERLAAGVLVVGALTPWASGRPEVNRINYVSRVKLPTLMLNGRYDLIFPLETHVKPMFDLLGTPPEHKKLKVYDSDHFVPRNEMIKEILGWLDRYLGPVR
jgi:dienelactone hydrolase